VLGGGEDLIEWAEVGSIGLGAVLVALAAKIALTTVSFGSGVPGGIFMPILAIGTLTGAGYALGARALGLSGDLRMALAVCGMAGVLAASVRTPLTSILLTAEMTGTLGHLLPVATVVIMSIFTADALRVPPIYDALLQRSLSGGSPAPAPSSRD
jgi:H+/Cl- antiporter ClcA